MMFDTTHFWEAMHSILIWTDFLVALLGGLLCGVISAIVGHNPRFDSIDHFWIGLLGVGFLGLVFFTGQFFSTYGRDGDFLAWRVVARYFIWLVFGLGFGAGGSIVVRARDGRWRDRRHGIRRAP